MWVCVHVTEGVPQSPGASIRTPRAGVTGSCEPPALGTANNMLQKLAVCTFGP